MCIVENIQRGRDKLKEFISVLGLPSNEFASPKATRLVVNGLENRSMRSLESGILQQICAAVEAVFRNHVRLYPIFLEAATIVLTLQRIRRMIPYPLHLRRVLRLCVGEPHRTFAAKSGILLWRQPTMDAGELTERTTLLSHAS